MGSLCFLPPFYILNSKLPTIISFFFGIITILLNCLVKVPPLTSSKNETLVSMSQYLGNTVSMSGSLYVAFSWEWRGCHRISTSAYGYVVTFIIIIIAHKRNKTQFLCDTPPKHVMYFDHIHSFNYSFSCLLPPPFSSSSPIISSISIPPCVSMLLLLACHIIENL